MADAEAPELLINGPDGEWSTELDPDGTLIGRSDDCDVTLDNRLVSREHARIHRDPFDRWIIEDLDSHNGVWINGRRTRSHALGPSDRIAVGPYTLTLSQHLHRRISPGATMAVTAAVVEGAAEMQLVTGAPDGDRTLSGAWLSKLNSIADRLSELTAAPELYPEACRCLAADADSTAVVLRIRCDGTAAESAEILACYAAGTGDAASACPESFRLSRRVIEAVGSSQLPVMAGTVRFFDGQLDLTAVGDPHPRAVFCSPITVDEGSMDLLYLQVPSARAGACSLDFVRAVARQVGFAAKSILHQQAAAERRLLDNQLTMAREIQAGLTPESLDISPGVDLALYYEPAMWVGGDYADVWALDDPAAGPRQEGRVAFAVGDVAGKGLPAALVMTNLHAALRTTVNFCADPSAAISYVNRHIMRHLPEGTFVTFVFGVFDPRSGRLEYVNAGHGLPLVVSAGGVSQLGRPEHIPLGIADADFRTGTETLKPGDTVVVVTDGVTEAKSPEGELFGDDRLLAVVRGASAETSGELVESIVAAVRGFRQSMPQRDDVTIFALRRR